MTAFTTAMLPTGTRAIATLEELHHWCTQHLLALNPTAKFVRSSGLASENRVSQSDYADADSILRIQNVVILEFDTSKFGQSLADWKQVKELSTTAALTAFSG